MTSGPKKRRRERGPRDPDGLLGDSLGERRHRVRRIIRATVVAWSAAVDGGAVTDARDRARAMAEAQHAQAWAAAKRARPSGLHVNSPHGREPRHLRDGQVRAGPPGSAPVARRHRPGARLDVPAGEARVQEGPPAVGGAQVLARDADGPRGSRSFRTSPARSCRSSSSRDEGTLVEEVVEDVGHGRADPPRGRHREDAVRGPGRAPRDLRRAGREIRQSFAPDLADRRRDGLLRDP